MKKGKRASIKKVGDVKTAKRFVWKPGDIKVIKGSSTQKGK